MLEVSNTMSPLERIRSKEYFLSKEVFKVQAKAVDLRSDEHIKMHGVYTTGDRDMDAGLLNNTITAYLSIPDMIAMIDRFAAFSFPDHSITVYIHKNLCEFLEAWSDHIAYSNTDTDAPIDDLNKLIVFLDMLDPLANTNYADTTNTPKTRRFFGREVGVSRKLVPIQYTEQSQKAESVSDSLARQLDSLSDYFSRKQT